MSNSKQAHALALRRQEKTWQQVATYFGVSQRAVKKWTRAAELREQEQARKEA